ncbi:MAG: cytochrome C [Gammaproteobacteria bacterium]|nr:MAG: cytochrome C [Gammaproteobacteria bacterium]
MREGRCHALLIFGWLTGLLAGGRAEAVNPETLLMPGKLSTAHVKYEETCSLCHDRSDRGKQTQLCLDCHKEIAGDLREHRHFHGRFPGIDVSECRACHAEHLGRTADIVKLSHEQFDHEHTDYPLRGAHVDVVCESCHAAGKPFRDAKKECIACHRKEEPHEGKLGRDCGSCHDESAWRHISYDHDKTAFPLRDKHAEAPCAACHFGNRYKNTPKECVSCHEPDDVHHGERGTKCAECHVTKGWKTSKFDHFKETGFPLEGVHDRIACNDCHRTGNLKDKLPRDCFGCHQAQDSHAGRLGKDCGICHGSEKWKPSSFDHTRDTTWPLTGQHEKVACHTCHTANVMTQKLPTECVSCHRPNDVHAGSLGKECDQCHTTQGWRASVSFDHDLTKFPLVGLHVTVPCEQCHLTRQYREVGHECIDCHKKDDVHKGNLGKDCHRCHSENGWKLWEFDHGKETGFALSGAHGKLACEACHRRPPDEVKLKQDCLTCHEKDDVHFGQYGRQCDRCHTTTTWKGAKVH